MSQLVVQNDQGLPEHLHSGIHPPPSSSSTDSILPQFMDSTFQDSPTIGRTQLLAYTPSDSNNPSQTQTPLSSAGSRYETANSRFSFQSRLHPSCVLQPGRVVGFPRRCAFLLWRSRRATWLRWRGLLFLHLVLCKNPGCRARRVLPLHHSAAL